MIRLLAGACAAGLLAAPVDALSCLRWNAADAYQAAAKSEARYGVVQGRLSFDATDLPKPAKDDPNESPPVTDIPARLTGKALSNRDFDTPFDQDVTLRVICLGPWCGRIRAGSEVVAFVERAADGDRIELSPCPGFVLEDPGPATLEMILSCHRGQDCPASFQ